MPGRYKYNAAGVQQWVARYDGPAQSTDVATTIALDNNGNVSFPNAFTDFINLPWSGSDKPVI